MIFHFQLSRHIAPKCLLIRSQMQNLLLRVRTSTRQYAALLIKYKGHVPSLMLIVRVQEIL